MPHRLRQPIKSLPPIVTEAREAVARGESLPCVLLAPVEDRGGEPVLPVAGHDIYVDPNFVAHIARALPGGEWHTTPPVTRYETDKPRPWLVYVINGEARALVAPIKRHDEAA